MRHYEIILMIHPDKSEKVSQIIEFYSNLVIIRKGKIHRVEDWGKRSLSYMIKKLQKAHYILMNIEVSIECMQYLENHFKFNSSIIRNLVLGCSEAVTKSSIMMKGQEKNNPNLTSLTRETNKQIK
ncbi:30S ribosomal protein S6 [Buchnera aphidicola]|uniref:30S ribosomal protein S6 n=1 Tax=Buchnera aphidicola TaxID=9 RepID=UPI00094DC175|nr:30S ribosomal protein S6 [Buchnera aphidicola]